MRLYQEVGNTLRAAIARGDYSIGGRLPPERDIAEYFDVSRSVVREALIMLELEHLIDVRKGSGVYVVALPQNVSSRGYGIWMRIPLAPLNCCRHASCWRVRSRPLPRCRRPSPIF